MLATLFSSRVRARLLTAFFFSPGVDRNAWELAAVLKESYSAVWRELKKLEGLGILISKMKGNTKVFQVNLSCPITPELRSIVMKTEGVGIAIQRYLNDMGNVKEAFIYGSFASGEADDRSDVDLMVIGEVDLDQFSPLITDMEKELNRPINYSIFTPEEWDQRVSHQEPFATNVIRAPRIMLIGGENAV